MQITVERTPVINELIHREIAIIVFSVYFKNVSFPNFFMYLTVPGVQNILSKFKQHRILTSEVSQDIVFHFRQRYFGTE